MVASAQLAESSGDMQTIPLYTGPAAAAARRGLMWRRIALRGDGSSKAQVNRDTFEAANQFRLARYLTEDAK